MIHVTMNLPARSAAMAVTVTCHMYVCFVWRGLAWRAVAGVYGDRGGGWVTEDDEPWPAAPRTKARLKAERAWLRLHVRSNVETG